MKNDAPETSVDWLQQRQETAIALHGKGKLPGDLMGLARKAQSISAEIEDHADCFTPDALGNIIRLCHKALDDAPADMQLEPAIGEDTQTRLAAIGDKMRALAAAYHNAGNLLRDIAAGSEINAALQARARYWLHELHDNSPVITDSVQYLGQVYASLDEALMNHYIGSTPWEERERNIELADGLETMSKMDKDDLKRLLKDACKKQNRFGYNQLVRGLHDVMEATKQLHVDMQGECMAGDLELVIAYQLRDQTPELKR